MSNKILGHVINPATGLVAEIREKKNGQKLPYMYTGKATYQGSPEERESWLSGLKEVGAFGVGVGEKPVANAPAAQPEQLEKQAAEAEWTPDETCPPEDAETEAVKESETPPKSAKKSGVFGWLVLGVVTAGLGLAGYKAVNSNKGLAQ